MSKNLKKGVLLWVLTSLILTFNLVFKIISNYEANTGFNFGVIGFFVVSLALGANEFVLNIFNVFYFIIEDKIIKNLNYKILKSNLYYFIYLLLFSILNNFYEVTQYKTDGNFNYFFIIVSLIVFNIINFRERNKQKKDEIKNNTQNHAPD